MPGAFAELIGESAAIVGLRRRLEQLVRRYATARRLPPLLLLGETGTGKSMIARALHQEGPRARHPFVDVNCAAIPATLMEAEMFGVERGAFTDARQAKPGLFTAADRGTILLDEIGLLPDALQAKLLKVVEEQQVRPVGGTVNKPIDVWIIAATSENLPAAMHKHRFREDLYHRLAVVTLDVPPLRERGHDVVLLAEHFLGRACKDYGVERKTFTPDALAALRTHRWPGNIRELGNVIERVALLSDASVVDAAALGLSAGAAVHTPVEDLDDGGAAPRSPIDDAVATIERDHLTQALAATGGNVTRAAQRLGLTRNTLRYRLRKHGLSAAAPEAASARMPAAPAGPSAAARWERRRVAFLRIVLTAESDHSQHAQRGLLEEVRQKVVAFGGILDGVSPLGLTAVFGLEAVEDASRRAAHAATAIRKLAVRARDVDPAAPTLKLAIHGMPALLWKLGDDVRVDMNARADAWQTLDRLVSRAGDGAIVVSESMRPSLGAAFRLMAAPEVEDVPWLVLDGQRAVALSTRTFVGRRDEMAMLQGRLGLARSGRAQVVGISGEPGIGKSRLLFEFHRTLEVDEVSYLGAGSVSYGRAMPLLPIIELVRRANDIDDGDSVAAVGAKVRARLTALGLPADEMAPYLLRLMDVSEGTEALRHLAPDAIHQRTLEIFQGLVVASSRSRPLVLAMEDLHWMDRASEGYLSALVDALVEAPIVVVTTYRTGYRPPWSDQSYVTELRLQPLARADAHRVLIGAAGGDRTLPTATADAILDRADGNPFFIEELARAVGPIIETAPTAVPESVEAVLLARIDRLVDECKVVLQAASVLGRDVSVRQLEAIIPGVATLKEHLRELQRREYLYDRSGGAHELYRFKHALTQEVAYASLLADDRRALHARIVGAIEAQHGDRLAEHTEKLAHHAVRGELWDKAIDYLRQAGTKAFVRSAHHEAAACFEQALQILSQRPEDHPAMAVDLRLDLFLPLGILAEYRRSLDSVTEAARLAERLGDRRRLAQALSNQCLTFRILGQDDEAIERGRRALEIAREIDDAALAMSANFYLGTAYTSRGDFANAVTCYRATMSSFAGDETIERVQALHRVESGARAWLAWMLGSLGEFEEALALGRSALQLARAHGAKALEAAFACLFANVHIELGDAVEAIGILESALEVCRSYHVRDWFGPVSMRLGYVYALVGRIAEAISLLEEGAAHSEAINQTTNYPARLATLAEAYLLAGRHTDAEKTAQRASTLAIEQRRRVDEALCLEALGKVLAAADPPDVTAADTHFSQALDLAATLGLRPLVAHCHLDLARLYGRMGKPREAHEHFALATTMYREMDMRIWLEKAESEIAAAR